jgi:hypothetical protein
MSKDGRKVSEIVAELSPYAKGAEINFKVKGLTFIPNFENNSANDSEKKLKYLKTPKKAKLIITLIKSHAFFST